MKSDFTFCIAYILHTVSLVIEAHVMPCWLILSGRYIDLNFPIR